MSSITNTTCTTYFPFPTLDRIQGEPTYWTLRKGNNKLNANTSAVPTIIGSGQHGMIGILMPNAEYYTLTGSNWNPPQNPGPAVVISQGTNAFKANQHIGRFGRVTTN